MTVQILVKYQILLKDSFEIWRLRRGDGPGGEVGSSPKISLWTQLEIDTEDFMNQYIIMVSMAKQVYLLAFDSPSARGSGIEAIICVPLGRAHDHHTNFKDPKIMKCFTFLTEDQ